MDVESTPKDSKPKAVKSETRLTFGVEIEYLLATVHPVHPSPDPRDPREYDGKKLATVDDVNLDILEKLKANDVPASMLWTSATRALPSDEELEANWLLKNDATVLGLVRIHPYYREFGMEMSSPPYYYDEASREVIRLVLKTLRKNYLVRVNSTTGLHVHVGNEYDGFTFHVLRNLVAILYTYERQIRLILPAERVQGLQQKFCRPFPWGSFGQANPDITRLDFLNHILSSENYEQLIIDFTTGSKRTIEFRLHQGTLDPDAILHFIHLCIKLTEKACLTKNQDALIERLRNDVEKPIGLGDQECSTVDMLMWLGCPAQAYYYGIAMVATDKQKFKERIEEDARIARDHAKMAYEVWMEARRKEKALGFDVGDGGGGGGGGGGGNGKEGRSRSRSRSRSRESSSGSPVAPGVDLSSFAFS
ncbi:b08c9a71-108c-486b-86c2-53296ade42aa [Sclerotinia trifoliorum]|uniref:B08c9a71-108c-486b-86c2-53296ade42aa n=1 Tax=Sclerotinia trifoliorum TaxID=28548 RepID=A0A8H2ZS51_9HELO|nr:b08c9a71-108c-486b-86c2-53296ade42aa [Sclerotinia trifoliorum]